MELYDLLYGISFEVVRGCIMPIKIRDIVFDSRKECSESIFVCIKGRNYDSHCDFEKVIQNGSKVIFIEKDIDVNILDKIEEDVLVLKVYSTRKALSYLCINFFGHPSKQMKIIGITGTRGKTSTSVMLQAMLNSLGHRCGIIGSMGVIYNGKTYKTKNTTPHPYELHKILSKLRDDNIDVVIIEISGAGLEQERIAGMYFDIAVLTNVLENDVNLEILESLESYINNKKKFFSKAKLSIINADDKYADDMIVDKSIRSLKYGLTSESEIRASDINLINRSDEMGISYDIFWSKRIGMKIHQLGRQNVYNSLAAVAVITAMGYDINKCKDALLNVVLPGRGETIITLNRKIVIDSAMTKTGHNSIFEMVSEYKKNHLYIVLSMDDQDIHYDKNELISSVLESCDRCAIVSKENLDNFDKKIFKFKDRREAIVDIIKNSLDDDIVLILGKGYYDKTTIEDDYKFVEEALELLNDSKGNS